MQERRVAELFSNCRVEPHQPSLHLLHRRDLASPHPEKSGHGKLNSICWVGAGCEVMQWQEGNGDNPEQERRCGIGQLTEDGPTTIAN